MNPSWLSEMSLGRRSFSWFAMILDKILYEALHKEMGLKQEKLDGLDSLGIKARKLEFMPPPPLISFMHIPEHY
jgi:hypothetical protein